MYISRRVKALPPAVLRLMVGASRPTSVDLAFGEPFTGIDPDLLAAGLEIYRETRDGYTQNGGLPELRERLLQCQNLKYFSTWRNVVVTVGATGALFALLLAVADSGDNVVLVEPCFFAYRAMAELLGLSVTAVELDAADDFAFNAARVASAVTSHTKAIIFCSPCNPTGRIYNQANLKELADLTATTGVWLVADETYRDFYYTVEPPASIGDVSDRAVVVRSFSKNCAMTGFRIGYLIGAEPLVDAVISVQRASLVCPPAISQRVALTALGNWSRWGDGMRGTYSILRETLLMAMAERLGWDIVPVEAGFFAFADIRRFGLNSAALARKVLDEADVVTVPGSAFGIGGEGYLRLSFSATPHQITTGIDRIARWVEGDIC